MRVLGPLAREALARLTALDLRPAVCPPGSFRPGSVARVPAMVLCEAEDRFLVLFGAALGHYMWTAVADAAGHLGGVGPSAGRRCVTSSASGACGARAASCATPTTS